MQRRGSTGGTTTAAATTTASLLARPQDQNSNNLISRSNTTRESEKARAKILSVLSDSLTGRRGTPSRMKTYSLRSSHCVSVNKPKVSSTCVADDETKSIGDYSTQTSWSLDPCTSVNTLAAGTASSPMRPGFARGNPVPTRSNRMWAPSHERKCHDGETIEPKGSRRQKEHKEQPAASSLWSHQVSRHDSEEQHSREDTRKPTRVGEENAESEKEERDIDDCSHGSASSCSVDSLTMTSAMVVDHIFASADADDRSLELLLQNNHTPRKKTKALPRRKKAAASMTKQTKKETKSSQVEPPPPPPRPQLVLSPLFSEPIKMVSLDRRANDSEGDSSTTSSLHRQQPRRFHRALSSSTIAVASPTTAHQKGRPQVRVEQRQGGFLVSVPANMSGKSTTTPRSTGLSAMTKKSVPASRRGSLSTCSPTASVSSLCSTGSSALSLCLPSPPLRCGKGGDAAAVMPSPLPVSLNLQAAEEEIWCISTSSTRDQASQRGGGGASLFVARKYSNEQVLPQQPLTKRLQAEEDFLPQANEESFSFAPSPSLPQEETVVAQQRLSFPGSGTTTTTSPKRRLSLSSSSCERRLIFHPAAYRYHTGLRRQASLQD